MKLFELEHGCEQLVFCRDDEVGLRALIAIHDTSLGPGLGGVRMRRYATEKAAIWEAADLARAMTLKNAVAGLPYGGAKAVILENGAANDRSLLMRRFGEFVRRTNGAYLPGVDMGTTSDDLIAISESGAHVSCHVRDPSASTALGVLAAIEAAVRAERIADDLTGLRVLVQGVGQVGEKLARHLTEMDAVVLVSDTNADRAARVAHELGAELVQPEDVYQTPCTVFAPSAIGGVIAGWTVYRLQCQIIAGAANNVLGGPQDASVLLQRGITYVPDFVANAGGVIDIHGSRSNWSDDQLRQEVLQIGERVSEILEEAAALQTTPLAVAEARAAATLTNRALTQTPVAVF